MKLLVEFHAIVVLLTCRFDTVGGFFTGNFPRRTRRCNQKSLLIRLLSSQTNTTSVDAPTQRWRRSARSETQLQVPCVLSIYGKRYNVTAWAHAHPGGAKILQRFHGKDATAAFEAAQHSTHAYEMLRDFVIPEDGRECNRGKNQATVSTLPIQQQVPRWKSKLFTKEDPMGVHKTLGLFCLLNFIFRYGQMYFGDPSAGLGLRLGKGPSWISLLCLVPHALLSLSSLLFAHIPKERVVGKPMIWQEYRVHNIAFGIRSIIATFLCAMAVRGGNTPPVRRLAVVGSCLVVLVTNIVADIGTANLRTNPLESTTATMPYWEGCNMQTQRRFKSFYAYSQFMATLACLTVVNPAWPLSVLLAIQLASLLMTLVRKGILSCKGYHYLYTASLVAPYFVGFRSLTDSPQFIYMLFVAWMMYETRRHGVGKYALWLPLLGLRVAYGDKFISFEAYL